MSSHNEDEKGGIRCALQLADALVFVKTRNANIVVSQTTTADFD